MLELLDTLFLVGSVLASLVAVVALTIIMLDRRRK